MLNIGLIILTCLQIYTPRVAKPCFLCGNAKKNNCELSEVVSSSGYTFSDVLAKLFSKEDLPPSLAEKDHSQGLLCSHCQSLVTDLFRLQKELKTVKNVIVRIYRNSETVCETATSVSEPSGHQKKEKIENNSTKIDTLSDNVTFEKAAQKRVREKKTNLIDDNKVDTQSSNQKRKRSRSKNVLDNLDNKAVANETSTVERKKRKKSIKVDPNFEYFGKAEEEETEVPESPADDAVYNIEALIAKKGSTYLVKWENYADDQNTWEPSYSIPDPIVEVGAGQYVHPFNI